MKNIKVSNTIIVLTTENSPGLDDFIHFLQENIYRIQRKATLEEVENTLNKAFAGIVLIDGSLPYQSAIQGLRKIDKLTPILLLAQTIEANQIEPLLTDGFNDILQLGLPNALLHARIKTFLKIKQNQMELAELQTNDSLTSLSNRRHFHELLDLEWRRCRRENQPISLLSIDLDSFSQCKEKLSDKEATEILQKIAVLLTRFANRAGDLCARYEDDNFMIIYSKTPEEGARIQAEKIRKAIEEQNIICDRDTTICLTASIGISTYLPDRSSFPRALLEKVHKNLTTAKKEGKNRVIFS